MLNTLGDHLRKARLDRGLSQTAVAKKLRVSLNAVLMWELNIDKPSVKSTRAIINFIGYFPFNNEAHSLGQQLHYTRLITGKTQKQVAKIIGYSWSSLRRVELDQQKPVSETREKIQKYIRSAMARLNKLPRNEREI